MFPNTLFCSFSGFFDWLQNNLIPCPFKKLTGIDCPGCGFQRAVIALLKGDLSQSLHLYPAAIPFILTCAFVLYDGKMHIDKRHLLKRSLFIVTGNIMLISYVIKLYTLYGHH